MDLISLVFIIALLHTSSDNVFGGPVSQFFISTPQNITVNSGEHTRLICRVGNMVGSCQWTRDGFALGADRSMTGYPRYIMSGTREDTCDLVIEPVLPLDEGNYQCQVSGSGEVAPITTNKVEIQVNSPPKNNR